MSLSAETPFTICVVRFITCSEFSYVIVPTIKYHEIPISYKTCRKILSSLSYIVKTVNNKLLYSTFDFLRAINDEQIVNQLIDDRPVQAFDLQLRYCQIVMQYNGIVCIFDGAICNGSRDSFVIS